MEVNSMRLKKILLFLGIIPLLTACQKASISGIYGFQLGKDSSTHFGVSMALSDDAYIRLGSPEDYNKMTLSLSAYISQNVEDTTQTINSIISFFDEDGDNKVEIPGYYSLTNEKNAKGESRITLGIDFTFFVERVRHYYEKQFDVELDGALVQELNRLNDNAVVQSIFYATYKSEKVFIYIPVSFDDIYYQLYWYGYDVQISGIEALADLLPYLIPGDDDSEGESESESEESSESEEEPSIDSFVKVVEVEKHTFGTHPTKEQVEEINKTFNETHKDLIFKTFRDYYSVQLGLGKK